jgi:hypothetical protein
METVKEFAEEIIRIDSESWSIDGKLNMILDLALKQVIDSPLDSEQLLKEAKRVIKKHNLSVTSIKLLESGNFELKVYVNAGCHGDWTNTEILSPELLYFKLIKPYN